MFTAQPIGFIHSPYHESSAVPKGLDAKHEAEGAIELLREFEPGLKDVRGSRTFWCVGVRPRGGIRFDAHPPSDEGLARRVRDAIAAAAQPDRPDGGGAAAPRGRFVPRARGGHAGRNAGAGRQAVYVERSRGEVRRGWLAEAEKRKDSF